MAHGDGGAPAQRCLLSCASPLRGDSVARSTRSRQVGHRSPQGGVKGRLGKRVGVPHDAAADQLRSRLSTTAARIAGGSRLGEERAGDFRHDRVEVAAGPHRQGRPAVSSGLQRGQAVVLEARREQRPAVRVGPVELCVAEP